VRRDAGDGGVAFGAGLSSTKCERLPDHERDAVDRPVRRRRGEPPTPVGLAEIGGQASGKVLQLVDAAATSSSRFRRSVVVEDPHPFDVRPVAAAIAPA